MKNKHEQYNIVNMKKKIIYHNNMEISKETTNVGSID